MRDLVALAHERGVPVLIHAGRGIPALGRDTVRLPGEFPGAQADPRPRRDLRPRLAVARDARAPEPVHRHGVVEPGRPDRAVHARAARRNILWASDSPYGLPLDRPRCIALRCALQAGLTRRAGARASPAAQLARAAGRRGAGSTSGRRRARRSAARPAARARRHPPRRGDGPRVRARRPAESLALARLACAVGDDAPHAAVCARGARAARPLRRAPRAARGRAPDPGRRPLPARARSIVARTPDVPLPRAPDAPARRRAKRPSCTSPRRPGGLAVDSAEL